MPKEKSRDRTKWRKLNDVRHELLRKKFSNLEYKEADISKVEAQMKALEDRWDFFGEKRMLKNLEKHRVREEKKYSKQLGTILEVMATIVIADSKKKKVGVKKVQIELPKLRSLKNLLSPHFEEDDYDYYVHLDNPRLCTVYKVSKDKAEDFVSYKVRFGTKGMFCNCPGSQYHQGKCKHIDMVKKALFKSVK